MEHNVTVGVGVMGVMGDLEISAWAARNTRFDVGWVRFFSIYASLAQY